MAEGKKVEGGVISEDVEIVRPEDLPPGKDMVNVITTGPGTRGPNGLVPIGTKMAVPLSAYSSNWMKTRDKTSANRVAKIAKDADPKGDSS
jgi:hypothetical protein